MIRFWKNLLFILGTLIWNKDMASAEFLMDFPDNMSYVEFSQQPQDIVAIISKPFILHCKLSIFSNLTSAKQLTIPANVTWFKNGKQIHFNPLPLLSRRTLLQNGSLFVSSAMHNSISDSDNGDYHCKASSNQKVLISLTAQVKIAVFPALSRSSESVSACISSSLNLDCNFNGAEPRPVISWYKNDRLIGSSRDSELFETFPSSSYVVLSDGDLEIRNLKQADSGSYYCSGKNPAGTKQGNRYTVNISDSPDECRGTSRFVSQPISSMVEVGGTAHLNCGFNNINGGQIKWLKNDKEITFRNRGRFKLKGQANLMIDRAQLSDTAEYSCVLEGQSSLVASAKLTVQEPPHLVSKPNRLHIAHIGCQISLHCSVGGTPTPRLTWYKDGLPMLESNKTKFKDNILLITITRKQDSGIYQCFAQNSVGQFEIAYKIMVVSINTNLASISTNDTISLESLTSSSARLMWSPFGFPTPTGYAIDVFDSTVNKHNVLESATPSCEIADLEENHAIHVVVTPFTTLCAGLPSKEITFTVPGSDDQTVDMVRNFAVEPMATSMLITWSAPANKESSSLLYQVQMQQLSEEFHKIESINTADTSQHFLGLQEYTLYRFQVAVLNPSGNPGPFTQAIETRTLQSAPDKAPSDITVTVESSDSVVVKWTPPPLASVNGPIAGYQIKYKNIPNGKIDTITTGAGNTQYRLSEKYRPGPPKLLETKTSARDIILMWLPPDDGVYVREYVIGWGESGPYEQTERANSEAQFYRITGLEPYTQYFISVRAKNKAGMGEEYHTELWTKALDDTPDELYPPVGVHATVLTYSTVNVSWHDTDRYQQERYYVVRYKTNVPDLPRASYVNSTDVNCILPGLRPHTVYDIAIRVVQGKRKSTWSMTVTITTQESIPGSAPTDLTVMKIENQPAYVQINWQPPVEPNGELNGYVIFYSTDQTLDIENWVIEPVVGDKLSTDIKGLTEDTQYYFRAVARNKQGVGPYSEIVSYRTPNIEKTVAPVKDTPKTMQNWMLYVIIGAVAVLVISIIIVSTIMICRNRKAKKAKKSPSRRSNGGIHSSGSGLRSPSGESYPYSVNSAPSGKSVNLYHFDDHEMQPLQSPDGRYVSEYPLHCRNAAPSELTPLNGLPKYPYSTHPHHHVDMMRSPLTSDSCQCYAPKGQYMNGNAGKVGNLHHSHCDDSQYEVDYRYHPPYTNVHPAGQQDYAVDSAYGSDHQHHQAAEDNIRNGKFSSLNRHRHSVNGESSDRTPSSDSLPSSSHSSDEQISTANSNIANVKDFLRVMNSSDDITSPNV